MQLSVYEVAIKLLKNFLKHQIIRYSETISCLKIIVVSVVKIINCCEVLKLINRFLKLGYKIIICKSRKIDSSFETGFLEIRD